MYSVFMSYGSGIKIISPSNVVAYMKRIINKMSLLYYVHQKSHIRDWKMSPLSLFLGTGFKDLEG